MLLKTNNTGSVTWVKTFGNSFHESGKSVQQTFDFGYIVVGGIIDSNSTNKILLIKTNSNGTVKWTKTLGGNNECDGSSVIQTSDSGYVITGYLNGDLFLMKINSLGDSIWTKTYGGNEIDYGTMVGQTTDGGFIVTGTTNSFSVGDFDIYLVKTDGNGNINLNTNEFINKKEKVTIFPNPASERIIITGNISMPAQFTLFDIPGKILIQKKLNSHYEQLDIHGLPLGIFIYELTDGSGNCLRGKLAVER